MNNIVRRSLTRVNFNSLICGECQNTFGGLTFSGNIFNIRLIQNTHYRYESSKVNKNNETSKTEKLVDKNKISNTKKKNKKNKTSPTEEVSNITF